VAAAARCLVATDRSWLSIFVAAGKKPELDSKVRSSTMPEDWPCSVRRAELSKLIILTIGQLNGG